MVSVRRDFRYKCSKRPPLPEEREVKYFGGSHLMDANPRTISPCPPGREQGSEYYSPESLRNSRISPGWQSSTSQMAARVENRTALAFPVFSLERLTLLTPTRSLSSFRLIFLSAIMRSSLTIISISTFLCHIRRYHHFLPGCCIRRRKQKSSAAERLLQHH